MTKTQLDLANSINKKIENVEGRLGKLKQMLGKSCDINERGTYVSLTPDISQKVVKKIIEEYELLLITFNKQLKDI